jgi:hypothetical protein
MFPTVILALRDRSWRAVAAWLIHKLLGPIFSVAYYIPIGVLTGIATSGFWIGNILVGEVSSILISSSLNVSGTLLLFALICFILFLFVLLLLPETKVVSTLRLLVGIAIRFSDLQLHVNFTAMEKLADVLFYCIMNFCCISLNFELVLHGSSNDIELACVMQGLTLEKIDEVFSKPWRERTDICYFLRCGCVLELLTKQRVRLIRHSDTEDMQRLTASQTSLSSSTSSSIAVDGVTEEHAMHLVVDVRQGMLA